MTEPGIHTVPAVEYHAGTDEAPRLSASIAHLLCTRSPKHAWTAHPRLNPSYAREEDAKFDLGKVVHSVLLEGEDIVYVVHEDAWRSVAAKEAREYGRSLGKVPLLAHQRLEVDAMVQAVVPLLAAHEADPPLLSEGRAEQTLVWDEDGIACKARVDWLRDDFTVIEDVKTTSRSAEPDAFSRRLYDLGYDLKAAFYVRGVEALTGVRPEFRWTVIETAAPYAISVVAPAPDVRALGDAKVDWAIRTWRECLASDSWPSYPQQVCFAELPPWEEDRWLRRAHQEAA